MRSWKYASSIKIMEISLENKIEATMWLEKKGSIPEDIFRWLFYFRTVLNL